jgi:hypothetical protein
MRRPSLRHLHVLPRITAQSINDGLIDQRRPDRSTTGLMTEALMAAVAQSDPDTQDRLAAFVDRKQNKVRPGS